LVDDLPSINILQSLDPIGTVVSEGSTTRLFADDCALYKDIKTTEDARKLQDDLEQLQKWERDWLMEFHQCAGITKIRLTMPRVKMSRADRNPWLAKMVVPLQALVYV
jgi:hypothetical protein